MTLPARLAGHVHVSERESAHHWPDGQFDDAAWEDCTMCAGVMFARLAHDLDIAPLHREAEALRDDAGEDPIGGTSTQDLDRGLRRRYGWTGARLVAGFDELWKSPTPWVAAVQGSMGAFGRDHRLRRHQRSFAGAHDVLIARLSAEDRAWWDDPLAPVGAYQGEWASKAEIRSYVTRLAQQFTPWAALAPIRLAVSLPDTSTTEARRVRVAPGAWFDYAVSGSKPYTFSRVPRTTKGFSAEIGREVTTTWAGATRRLVRVTSGAYLGRWVDLNDAGSVSLLAA